LYDAHIGRIPSSAFTLFFNALVCHAIRSIK
jgi:hypothetical protein